MKELEKMLKDRHGIVEKYSKISKDKKEIEELKLFTKL